jgi:hypothetical protein
MDHKQTFVPPDFYCPITGELMLEPVSDPEGHTYEKSQILTWLSTSKTSPITRSPLNKEDLTDNIAMKRSIESIREKLTEDQLKIDSILSEEVMAPYVSKIGELKLTSYYMNNQLFLKIDVPDIPNRSPVDIVLCIDVSYSMGSEATLKGSSNETVSHGISVLSLTVSAAKTILHSLNEHDNVSIVTYSEKANTLCSNVSCSYVNRVAMEAQLDSLKPTFNTNMWSGIHESLDILRTTSPDTRVKGVLLLTDGIPNVEPPRGHEYMLEKYFKDHNFNCMVSCYGFGYSLMSELLLNISEISGGDGFSFIPDASLLGNVFIHGISNLLSTAISNVDVKICLTNGALFPNRDDSISFKIDSLKYGQSKNFIFNVNVSEYEDMDDLDEIAEITLITPDVTIQRTKSGTPEESYYLEQKYRHEAIHVIDQCISKKKFNDNSFKSLLNELITDIQEEGVDNEYISNILFDLSGQVKEALNMTREGERHDWFSRWGIHYLRSLKDAYKNEVCNNFKDKGVSNFSGEVFNRIRDQVSDIFDTLPPPKADIVSTAAKGSVMRGGGPPSRSAPTSMRVYNNASGGCCAKGSIVLMADETYKKVEELKKGDEVYTYDSENRQRFSKSRIECVVETNCPGGTELLSTIGTLKITPYHPIIHYMAFQEKWKYPANMVAPSVIPCESMFTFVIENRKSLIVEGFVFCTYGHGLTGDVISHDYFGTDKVINDIKKFNTYEYGHVLLEKTMFHRKNKTVVNISSDDHK